MSPRTRFDSTICYLCGEPMGRVQPSSDHVPPKRWFPTQLRPTLNRQLLTLKTHPECHRGWNLDEDYLFNTVLPNLLDAPLGSALAHDFQRSLEYPENRRLAEAVARRFTDRPGGLVLPPGRVVQMFDAARIRRVLWKVVRGLYFAEAGRSHILPETRPRVIELYGPQDPPAPDLVIAVMGESSRGLVPEVLDYKILVSEDPPAQFWDLLLWERYVAFVAFHDVGCRCNACTDAAAYCPAALTPSP